MNPIDPFGADYEARSAEEELTRLRRERDQLREVLESVEWEAFIPPSRYDEAADSVREEGGWACPVCVKLQRDGHDDDCALRRALDAALIAEMREALARTETCIRRLTRGRYNWEQDWHDRLDMVRAKVVQLLDRTEGYGGEDE